MKGYTVASPGKEEAMSKYEIISLCFDGFEVLMMFVFGCMQLMILLK